jgi:osmotically-inducible protein OsmY
MRTIVVAACALIVGCSRSDQTATQEPVSTTTITAAPVTLAGPSDEALVRRVEAAVSSNAELSIVARGIELDVTEGVVTLRGATPDPAAKDELEAVVARVPGVVETLNKIELRTPSDEESDDTIAFSLQRALVTDPAVSPEADRVTIEVNRGIVTLRGTTTPEMRASVERVVRRTPGVVVIENRLTNAP